eukprot:CAMPEP_0171567016 /NCGR_PEP_ID=MMETSP0961-20121227/912_1 /TAXON_ID=87120 /ORGANISM="Aurantiochytrium limacinum, Strain ATCCMYA-1381" /LENGTH=110 /DNA_ID=CAMNT_0012120863 /DNA_START=333 /DNA_END=666 /DNA_ORIENTATION=-
MTLLKDEIAFACGSHIWRGEILTTPRRTAQTEAAVRRHGRREKMRHSRPSLSALLLKWLTADHETASGELKASRGLREKRACELFEGNAQSQKAQVSFCSPPGQEMPRLP